MTRLLTVFLALSLGVIVTATTRADDGDTATLTFEEARIGQPVTLRLEVITGPDSTVELDPASDTWGAVEVVGIDSQEAFAEGGNLRHVIVVRVAPFDTGTQPFVPRVNVVTGAESQPRELPGVQMEVLASLAPDAPLELSPLPAPSAISGGESPFLRPLIALGAVLSLLLVGGLTYLAVRAIARRPRRPREDVVPEPAYPDLSGAAALLESDPVSAYRTLSSAVRRHLGERYGFPAVALTARELETRMEAEGVNRWEARLVGGLLENCEAVVYAGYRPASERREADLTMAREIVEAGA
ncbi:MAG: hypothetical protein ACRDHF_08140 [Tepidiformaceae bacterium]